MRPALPPLGHAPWFWADTTGFLRDLARDQGDVARFRLAGTPAFLLSHPDHVRQVLVDDADRFRKGGLMRRARRLLGNGLLTSEGAAHHDQRRRIQPAFARRQLAAYGDRIPGLAGRAAEQWRDGEVLDLRTAMDELSLAIAADSLLGETFGRDTGRLLEDLRTMARWGPLLAAPMVEGLERVGCPPFRAVGQAADRIRRAVLGAVGDGRPSPHPGGLLPCLRQPASDGSVMSPELARDEAVTLLLAGHDTTAAMLTWCWYLLATHPPVWHRLRAELISVLGPRDPGPADVAELAYTGMVVEETLRLYPPIGRIGRRPISDYDLAGCRIPAGAAVFVSPFVTQRDPRWWPEPDRFDPDRWRPEAGRDRPRYAAFPFGAGPRSCIGAAMARLTGVLVVATVAQRWRMDPPARAPRIRSLLTLKPADPLPLELHALGPGDAATLPTARDPGGGDLAGRPASGCRHRAG
jgi:cytochrome P450